jgi:hypothetical protein
MGRRWLVDQEVVVVCGVEVDVEKSEKVCGFGFVVEWLGRSQR